MTSQVRPLITLSLVFACAATTSLAQPKGDAKVGPESETIESVFGEPIAPGSNLHEIDRHFVLEVERGSRGHIAKLSIVPKHWFSEQFPEWEESEDVGELAETDYLDLLKRLDRVRTRGHIETADDLAVVQGTTLRRRDVYEHAVVVRGEVEDSDSSTGRVKYIIVSFEETTSSKR